MPMQPSPRAETSRSLFPSLRFRRVLMAGVYAFSVAVRTSARERTAGRLAALGRREGEPCRAWVAQDRAGSVRLGQGVAVDDRGLALLRIARAEPSAANRLRRAAVAGVKRLFAVAEAGQPQPRADLAFHVQLQLPAVAGRRKGDGEDPPVELVLDVEIEVIRGVSGELLLDGDLIVAAQRPAEFLP